jgi:hypothetical protein
MMIEGIAHDISQKENAMDEVMDLELIEDLDLDLDQADEENETEAPAEVTFSAKELATLCDTDAKTFRRWLRTQTEQRANKGGRWVFDAEARDHYVEAFLTRNDAPADDEVEADAD